VDDANYVYQLTHSPRPRDVSVLKACRIYGEDARLSDKVWVESVVSLILGVRDLHLKDSIQLQFVKRESHRPISDANHHCYRSQCATSGKWLRRVGNPKILNAQTPSLSFWFRRGLNIVYYFKTHTHLCTCTIHHVMCRMDLCNITHIFKINACVFEKKIIL
jgi:hypothetical protein